MQGDILDEVIEKYSPNEAWRDWENAWARGQLPARDCLRLQVGNMRVSRERLLEDLARVRIDPAFAEIVEWARLRQVGIKIVSDSFVPLIRHILRRTGSTASRYSRTTSASWPTTGWSRPSRSTTLPANARRMPR